ncbi:MAG: entericidin, EcnA/B family [Rhodobacteraceae bacterium]|nr:entericidin, EcnA/B family [Paracoccaceae bacterium]
MRRILIAAMLCGLAACATVEGVGNDLSAGASKVRNVF